jgi:DNA-binding ferritin-like protein (Dps family)
MTSFIEKITGDLSDKREWRAVKARAKALPEGYADAVGALQRYSMMLGGVVDGPTMVRMHSDLVEMFETAAADGTPIRDIVGDNPGAFIEDFTASYDGKDWRDKERARLAAAIDAAAKAATQNAGE